MPLNMKIERDCCDSLGKLSASLCSYSFVVVVIVVFSTFISSCDIDIAIEIHRIFQ